MSPLVSSEAGLRLPCVLKNRTPALSCRNARSGGACTARNAFMCAGLWIGCRAISTRPSKTPSSLPPSVGAKPVVTDVGKRGKTCVPVRPQPDSGAADAEIMLVLSRLDCVPCWPLDRPWQMKTSSGFRMPSGSVRVRWWMDGAHTSFWPTAVDCLPPDPRVRVGILGIQRTWLANDVEGARAEEPPLLQLAQAARTEAAEDPRDMGLRGGMPRPQHLCCLPLRRSVDEGSAGAVQEGEGLRRVASGGLQLAQLWNVLGVRFHPPQ